MAEKRIPERMCLGCGEMKPKGTLLRIVKCEEGIFPDPTGKRNGRGAYVCNDPECMEKLMKKKGLDRAFKCHVSAETYRALTEACGKLHE